MATAEVLLLAPEWELDSLASVLVALNSQHISVTVPQRETRVGESIIAVLDRLVGMAEAVLIVNAPGPPDPMIERATFAFQARLATRAVRKLLILDRPGSSGSFERHGYAVVLPSGLNPLNLAKLIRIALTTEPERSTLHVPTVDNYNAPFLSVGAWPVSFLGELPSRGELVGTTYEEASGRYWSGLNRSGFAGDWPERLAASRILVGAARRAGDPSAKSLILSKGIAYSQIARGNTGGARWVLRAATDAAVAARDPRALGYALAYQGDSWAADNQSARALRAYDEALGNLRGVEHHELLLRRDMVARLSDPDSSRATRMARLEALQSEFDSLLNYRAGAIDIALAREAALGGALAEARTRVAVAEEFFRNQVPMPRNLDRALAMRAAIDRGTGLPGARLSW